MSLTSPPAETAKGKTAASRLSAWTLNFLSALVWLYIFIKLFVFDIDIYLVTKINPELIWIIHFKFFILLGIVALLFLLTRSVPLLKWSLYVLFFPLIILFWKIPYFIFRQKSWLLGMAFANAVVSLCTSLKYKVIAAALFLISQFLIIEFENKLLLISA